MRKAATLRRVVPVLVGLAVLIAHGSGCARAPEATRFVPAAAAADRAPTAADHARPEVRKIEMH